LLVGIGMLIEFPGGDERHLTSDRQLRPEIVRVTLVGAG
jgi:hypothetical protein